ncbi:hypothetical protein HDZ31DRAFT_30372 [Schizophyllum fasciatum]
MAASPPPPPSLPPAACAHPLIVYQRALDSHVRRTEHWGLAVLFSRTAARVFEIVGNTDSFGYVPRAAPSYAADPAWRGGLLVAHVPRVDIDALDARLRALPIVKSDPDFDCQIWVLAALRALKQDGVIPPDIDVRETVVRAELELEKERWEAADDTVDERLFPFAPR